jgi:hypothetical protein
MNGGQRLDKEVSEEINCSETVEAVPKGGIVPIVTGAEPLKWPKN